MMSPDDHIQEVLARGNGWKLRGDWPTLEAHSPGYAYIIIHDPDTDTWGRTTYTRASRPGGEPTWILGYFSAAAAADEIEQLVSACEVLA